MRKLSMAAGVLVLLGCRPLPTDDTPANSSPPADVQQAVANYSKFVLMTKNPVPVDPSMAAMCAPATPPAAGSRGVMLATMRPTMRVYMTQPAADVYSNKSDTYLAGSIIVKEKGSADADPAHVPEHRSVGGMIKRDADYDPKHGNWEYFYKSEDGSITSGKIQSCVTCHTSAKADYVFEWHGPE